MGMKLHVILVAEMQVRTIVVVQDNLAQTQAVKRALRSFLIQQHMKASFTSNRQLGVRRMRSSTTVSRLEMLKKPTRQPGKKTRVFNCEFINIKKTKARFVKTANKPKKCPLLKSTI